MQVSTFLILTYYIFSIFCVILHYLFCRYPDDVMKQVSVLAKDIGVDYKSKQKQRLQRTFVRASDAANAKVTGAKKLRT